MKLPILTALLPLAIAGPAVAQDSASQRRSNDTLQRMVDRVQAIQPSKRAIGRGSGICTDIGSFQEYATAILDRDVQHAASVPGCDTVERGIRVGLLRIRNGVAAEVRILPPGPHDPTDPGLVVFTLLPNIVDIDTLNPQEVVTEPPRSARRRH